MFPSNKGLLSSLFLCKHAFKPNREKTYLPTDAHIEDSDQTAQSDLTLRCPHKETLHPWLSTMRPVKILIRLRKSQTDLNLRCAHISEGTVSNVAAYLSKL